MSLLAYCAHAKIITVIIGVELRWVRKAGRELSRTTVAVGKKRRGSARSYGSVNAGVEFSPNRSTIGATTVPYDTGILLRVTPLQLDPMLLSTIDHPLAQNVFR